MASTAQRGLTAALFAQVVALAAAAAWAEPAEQLAPAARLERARERLRAFEYDEAIAEAEAVLEDAAATASLRVQALELTGAIHLLERREPQAREAFNRLLTLDPGHRISDPELPPRVQEAYERLVLEPRPVPALSLALEAPEQAAAEAPAPLVVTPEGEVEGIERVVLLLRQGEGGSFERREMARRGHEFSLELAAPEGGEAAEYYIQAESPSGFVLARSGSEEAPHRLEAPAAVEEPVAPPPEPPPPRRRWYASWWFWTVVGAVVVGGTVTAAVLARPDQPPDGTIGSMQMPLLPGR